MDVVDEWSGRYANALQSALRMTREEFAEHLGVAPRTVAAWHKDPGIVPRAEIQRALDTVHEKAPEPVRRRFDALTSPQTPVEAQALRVAIAVVVRTGTVLLVCRRGSDALTWQFPAGVVKPGHISDAVAVQETHAETGVHCTVKKYLGSRLHPTTGVQADYYLAEYLAGDVKNVDPLENTDAVWAPIENLTRFIPIESIYPPILAALEGNA